MLVHVLMGSARCHGRGMIMGVVHVAALSLGIGMAVLVVMQQWLVGMLVTVPLGQVQSNADGHQRAAD